MTNIFYKAYIEHYKDTSITPIEGKIIVKTEYTHYKDIDSSTPKRQDMRIESDKDLNYVEFQRKPYPKLSIDVRSAQYFGFSLTSGCDKHTSHLWLVDGEIGKLLHKNTFSNYILMDEVEHYPHPNTNNILYVNLDRLAQVSTQAGELAKVLIGKLETPTDPEISIILKNLKSSFEAFREDKKVRDTMTRKEEIEAEARAELIPIISEQAEKLAVQDEKLAVQDEKLAVQGEKLAMQDEKLAVQAGEIAEQRREIEELKSLIAEQMN